MFDQISRALPANQSSQFIPLIDGDIIKYRIGFAAQTTEYSLYVPEFPKQTHPHPNLPFIFTKKTDMNAFIEAHELDKDVLYWDEKIIPDKVENALHSVKRTLQSILDKIGTTRYIIFLSGEDNFRDNVAVTRKYKGNRDNLTRPYHYWVIHDYLRDVWGARVVEGMEADDAMGIQQMADMEHAKAQYITSQMRGQEEKDMEQFLKEHVKTIIVTLDKDLDMIPGWHYNWLTEENAAHIGGMFKWISHAEALKTFFVQTISGDSTDNIPGVRGLGQAKAKKLLDGLSDAQSMYDAALAAYKTHVKTQVADSTWSDEDVLQEATRLMDEAATLVWILRRENGKGKPPYRHKPQLDMKLKPQELSD